MQEYHYFCYDIFLLLDDADDQYLGFDEITDVIPFVQKHSAKSLDQLKEIWNKLSGGENM